MIRRDARLSDRPMQRHGCATCGAVVRVGKSSWDQTSVQWDATARAACLEARAAGHVPRAGCLALRDSIREAAVRGELAVPDD